MGSLPHSRKCLQACAATGFLTRIIAPPRDMRGMDEMIPEVGNMFEEQDGVIQRYMIEEDHVLMDLPHVAHVGNHWHTKSFCHGHDA